MTNILGMPLLASFQNDVEFENYSGICTAMTSGDAQLHLRPFGGETAYPRPPIYGSTAGHVRGSVQHCWTLQGGPG